MKYYLKKEYINLKNYKFKIYINILYLKFICWGLGIGDLGIGDWAQSPIPNPQSPIPNPHLPFLFKNFVENYKLFIIIFI